MKKARRVLPLVASAVVVMALAPYFTTIAYAGLPSIPSSVVVAVGYADTEGRASNSGTCANCFPSPWCGSPGVQFIGASTNYDGNSTNPENCQGGDWDTGAILVVNTGVTPITFTNLTVTFPLPSSGSSVIPTCTAEQRPITFNVWFGHQYYWHNQADPAFYGGPVVVPPGGQAIFAGTSSDNSYNCPTGNYPSTGPINGTYDFDTSDAYYLDGCMPSTDPSSAPAITFSADGYATTAYNDTGHTLDTGGIDTGNCGPTAADPQWGHENLGWRLVGTCGETCPLNQFGVVVTTITATVTASAAPGGVSTTVAYGIAGVAAVFIIATSYLAMRRGKGPV